MPQKSVLITGCSHGGVGHALAETFQSRGFHVFATARTLSKMHSLGHLPDTTLLTLDVTCTASIATAVEAVKRETGGTLDCLVNNAVQLHVMPLLDTNLADAKKIFDVNFWGAMDMIRAFAPLLVKTKGSIVNVSSMVAKLSTPWIGKYSFPNHTG